MSQEAMFSVEAEEALLGALMTDVNWLSVVSVYLKPADFFIVRNGLIFAAMQKLVSRQQTIEPVSLAHELNASGQDYGGMAYLWKLIADTSSAIYAEIWARLIVRCAARREMIAVADQIKDLSGDESIDIEQLFEQAEASLMKLRAMRQEQTRITMKEAMEQADTILMERMAIYQVNPNYILGVRTGFDRLDSEVDGLPVGITTLAAVTGMGKTACALTIAMNTSKDGIDREEKRPARVNLFSGEMTQEQLNWRLLSMKSGVPVRHIARGMMNGREEEQYIRARDSLVSDHALTFESVKRMTVHQIRDTVRQMVNHKALDLLIIDGLLQIDALKVSAGASKSERAYMMDKRRDSIEYILNELEDITATYETRVLLTHQISRQVANRANKRPVLSDLAEANFVEQKSSLVLFLYREGYYDAAADPEATELIVAKNRNGDSPTIYLVYNRQYTRFENGRMERVDLTQF